MIPILILIKIVSKTFEFSDKLKATFLTLVVGAPAVELML
jgi:hypothetical protein